MKDYRTRIYENYASDFQDATETFDESSAWNWARAYKNYLYSWLPKSKEASILEVACGGGRLLYYFKRMGYSNLTGVDVSPSQVNLAKQVTSNVHEADALEFLEANRGQYDLIIGLDIVEHFYKPEVLQFLDGCYASLKPGGRLILQTQNADSPFGTEHRYGDFTHELSFNTNSLKRLMTLVGFSDIVSREAGPVVHGIFSLGRYLIWKIIRLGLIVWNLAETGNKGSGVCTRIFLITGRKLG